MRSLLRTLAIAGVAALAMPASITHAASGDVVPYRVPPGGMVSIDIFGCASGTTAVVIDIGPEGGAALLDDAAAAVDGAAHFDERVPIDASNGSYVVRVWCKNDDATTIDTAELTFEVATLSLQLSRSAGPVGSAFTVSGSGCPTGVTDRVFAFIDGAGDDQPVWDPSRQDGASALPEVDGSFTVPMRVPASAPLGENLVSVYCVSEGGSALAGPFLSTFIVTEADAVVPATGAPTMMIVWLATGLLAAGMVLLTARRSIARTR